MIHQDSQDFPWGSYTTYRSPTLAWLNYRQRVICRTESGDCEPALFLGTNGSGSLHNFERDDGSKFVLTYAVIRDYLPA